MLLHKKPKRPIGHNQLLHKRYLLERFTSLSPDDAIYSAEAPDDGSPFTVLETYAVRTDYRAWLSSKGIDPETGTMTEEGVAFFKTVIEEQNAVNRATRGSRRRPQRRAP